ncbi:MAG TPA: plastocyanin/azurin family copper-binding protein [Candidatus Binataceae bacterium]|nr:plastocyanin/azurin family copper-binding protein [Candidatus Binataceae bacterium]
MKKIHVLCRVLLVAGALTLGVATSAFAAQTVEIKMFDTPAKYMPDPIKIKVGDTVKWVNKGDTIHTATTDPANAPDPSWVSIPKGAETFDSGYMNGGEEFSYTFTVPGVYHYFCTTHVKEGMKGEIDVEQ